MHLSAVLVMVRSREWQRFRFVQQRRAILVPRPMSHNHGAPRTRSDDGSAKRTPLMAGKGGKETFALEAE